MPVCKAPPEAGPNQCGKRTGVGHGVGLAHPTLLAVFRYRIPRSLIILISNPASRLLKGGICQGRGEKTIFYLTLLAEFITYNYTGMWYKDLHLYSCPRPPNVRSDPPESSFSLVPWCLDQKMAFMKYLHTKQLGELGKYKARTST